MVVSREECQPPREIQHRQAARSLALGRRQWRRRQQQQLWLAPARAAAAALPNPPVYYLRSKKLARRHLLTDWFLYLLPSGAGWTSPLDRRRAFCMRNLCSCANEPSVYAASFSARPTKRRTAHKPHARSRAQHLHSWKYNELPHVSCWLWVWARLTSRCTIYKWREALHCKYIQLDVHSNWNADILHSESRFLLYIHWPEIYV